jgi:hypothetical protein
MNYSCARHSIDGDFSHALPQLPSGTALELNIALLYDGSLLDGDHLSLHLRQLGGCLVVADNEEDRRPKDDDRGAVATPSFVRWLS